MLHSTVMDALRMALLIYLRKIRLRQVYELVFESPYLRLEDRKNMRLTCREWYHVCSNERMIKKEKFVFRSGTCDDSVTRLSGNLLRCKALRTHFEFQGLHSVNFEPIIWGVLGRFIRSLVFFNCVVDEHVILNVIQHCKHLITLRVQLGHIPVDLSTWAPALDRLIAAKVQRLTLETLELRSLDGPPNTICEKLFQIYPAIKTLVRASTNDEKLFVDRSPTPQLSRTDDDIRGDNPKNEWTIPPTVKNFISHVADVRTPLWKWPQIKFKEFATMLELDILSTNLDAIFEFFGEQTELRRLRLMVWGPEDASGEYEQALLLHVLDSSPALKELEFYHNCGIFEWTEWEFELFLEKSGRLQSLCLFFLLGCESFGTYTSPESSSSVYKYSDLKTLRLGYGIPKGITLEILRRCRTSLIHVQIDSADEEIMRRIYEFHTDVRTLDITAGVDDLDQCEGASTSSMRRSAIEYAATQLPNLQRLELFNLSPNNFRSFLPCEQFDLPHLTFVRVEFVNNADDQQSITSQNTQALREVLDFLSLKAPRVEIFSTVNGILSTNELVHYSKRWKSLKFLSIGSIIREFEMCGSNVSDLGPQNWEESNENIKKLFAECPSLHSVNNLTRQEAYMYDRTSKKLKLNEYGGPSPKKCRYI